MPAQSNRRAASPAGNFSDTAVQGKLVHDMRYLASVVTNCFGAFGELLGMQVTQKLLTYKPTCQCRRGCTALHKGICTLL